MAEPAVVPEGFGRRELSRIRTRYLELRDRRLERIKSGLQRDQRLFLELLPLLFHVNHPLLPGFVDSATPAGVADYRPGRHELLLARRHARGFSGRAGGGRSAAIRALYLMGSLGSLGQEPGSDLDIWLCYAQGLEPPGVAALRRKIAAVEAWGSSLGLQVHIFPVQPENFRDGRTLPLSDESSGRLGRHLLLEEFYRSGVLLAGLPPLWWLVPPEHENDYAAYTQRLRELRLLPDDLCVDFGGLDVVPPHEFYSAAQWQLHKSIASPYKALLKLMLSEAYAADYPAVAWISQRTKQMLFGTDEIDVDALDPYRLILERITDYLRGRGEVRRLELARRAFYVKAGQQLSRQSSGNDWRRQGLEALVEEWGWDDTTLREMDARGTWKLARVQRERNALVAELSRGLRLLSEFARTHAASPGLDARELSLLGRKLYATLERRPGKIDRVNPGISQDLTEPDLWLVHQQDGDTERWLLYLAPPGPGVVPVKHAGGLVELLAWVHVNGLADRGSRLRLLPTPPPRGTPEHQQVLETLQRLLPAAEATPGAMEAFARPVQVQTALCFLDVGRDPGDLGDPPLRHLDHLSVTNWGEILVQRRVGAIPALLDCLCADLGAGAATASTGLEVRGLATSQAASLAALTAEVARAATAWRRAQGPDARYLFRLEGRLYLMSWTDEACHWLDVGDAGQLAELLGESDGRFHPTRMDPRALPGSPLPLLLEYNRRDVIQVFYWVHAQGIDLWVLDDTGSLFQQHLPHAWEAHFLSHQHRFFDGLLVRRLLHGAVPAEGFGQALQYHRLSRNEHGWRVRELPLPDVRPGHLELLVVTGSSGTHGDFRLICDEREFDAALLGDTLYATVAAEVLARRRGRERYPIYITGVQSAEADRASSWSVSAMLRLKSRLERRLNAAMGLVDGPARPAGSGL